MGLSLTGAGLFGAPTPGRTTPAAATWCATADIDRARDLGPGTLANAQRHIDLTDLDAVVLTHEHPDHWRTCP